MSLRADIHSAFDEVMPETAGLADRMAHSAATARPRVTTIRQLPALRMPLSLVAVLLVIAIVVGVLVGSRLYADWQSHRRSVPVGQVDQANLKRLESRPVVVPAFLPDAQCNGGPWDSITGRWGAAPVYFASNMSTGYGGQTGTAWGAYFSFLAQTDPTLSGPVLVRAYNLSQRMPVWFVGDYANGAVAGSDIVRGQTVERQPELVLDASHPPDTRAGDLVQWSFIVAVSAGTSVRPSSSAVAIGPNECTFCQVDGVDFTESIYITF